MSDPKVERLTEREAAKFLGVSVALLQKWRRNNRGPAWMKFGWAIRYDCSDLEAYMATHRRTSREELR